MLFAQLEHMLLIQVIARERGGSVSEMVTDGDRSGWPRVDMDAKKNAQPPTAEYTT